MKTPEVAALPVLVAVNEAIALPEPLAPIPIVVLLLAHVYVVPVTLLVNTSVEVLALLQTVCAVGETVMIGVGFTVIVNVCALAQPVPDGVTVNTATAALVPVFTAVKEAMLLPEPLAPMPILVLLFVQV